MKKLGTNRTGFCCWILSNILFSMPVVLYAGYMMLATSACIFISIASFSAIKNAPQCVFSIGTNSLVTEYSHSFWLAVATGLLCATIGILVVVLYFLIPDKLKEAFSAGVYIDEDDDSSSREGYFNTIFLDGVIVTPATSKRHI
ncbi:dual oxidase maturation factor 1 [Boleophthalmus pectinirostris]|uniref:dual oxidase maturation factor 1 n=1 Tax=Boleophthalmus pectinirostris TaxID=150288 RepID=UPI00242BD856|nr:dual oxidase maturation factor 1 [Boleophthalmus pectinirostris]